ncbi:hypothetical protein CROQUDRAFT_130055 [Cronartium quercuum f. sp. fusiforme G11]|uniref:beta-glucosidase n=1 Tax=Cronartium quercuum f. sp. fusiforme G11 TaxID=708437 RepID=A0A9P6TGD7_9BASI|nr:hypothetical protein CROQUDRAFT_130055 [Cronartium quercuum f. sp. fusiforme G11]
MAWSPLADWTTWLTGSTRQIISKSKISSLSRALTFSSSAKALTPKQTTNKNHVNVQADLHKLIREIGPASTVLLKNLNHTLPLRASDKLKSVAILGSDSGDNPNGINSRPDRTCNSETLANAYIRDANPALNLQLILNDTNYEQSKDTARVADVTHVHVSSDSGEGAAVIEGHAGTRTDLNYISDVSVPQINYPEKLTIDYGLFEMYSIKSRFEYGFGLSYTTFKYTDIKLNKSIKSLKDVSTSIDRDLTAIELNFKVDNTRSVDGHEVSQLSLSFLVVDWVRSSPSGAGEPPKVLRGFERVFIKAGHSATVSIKLRVIKLSIW